MRTLTLTEYAQFAGISKKRVSDMIKAGAIPAKKVSGKYEINVYSTREYINLVGLSESEKRVYAEKEFEKLAKLTAKKLRDRIKRGQLQAVKIGGKYYIPYKPPEKKKVDVPTTPQPECRSIYEFPLEGRRRPKGFISRDAAQKYADDISPSVIIYLGCETGKWHVYVEPSDPEVRKEKEKQRRKRKK